MLATVALAWLGSSCATIGQPTHAPLLGADHPLTGKIWSPKQRQFFAESELSSVLRKSRLVLLGERHDNPRHHALQGRLIDELVSVGKHPVVVFEMITTDRREALGDCLAHGCTPKQLARAAQWNESGWPDWRTYGPIFEAIDSHDLIVMPGGLPQTTIRALTDDTTSQERTTWIDRLGLRSAPPPTVAAAMADEIREAHCGQAPESMLDGMILAQRARDAFMARSLEAAASGTSAVLIAGAGHVRNDRAVPTYLGDGPPEKLGPVTAVAFVEVRAGLFDPREYATGPDGDLPYDYVWFTERVDDVDPCEKFREQLERMKARNGSAAE